MKVYYIIPLKYQLIPLDIERNSKSNYNIFKKD